MCERGHTHRGLRIDTTLQRSAEINVEFPHSPFFKQFCLFVWTIIVTHTVHHILISKLISNQIKLWKKKILFPINIHEKFVRTCSHSWTLLPLPLMLCECQNFCFSKCPSTFSTLKGGRSRFVLLCVLAKQINNKQKRKFIY